MLNIIPKDISRKNFTCLTNDNKSFCWELGTNKSCICLAISLWKIFWYTAGNFRDKEKRREKNCLHFSAFYLEIIKFRGSEGTFDCVPGWPPHQKMKLISHCYIKWKWISWRQNTVLSLVMSGCRCEDIYLCINVHRKTT